MEVEHHHPLKLQQQSGNEPDTRAGTVFLLTLAAYFLLQIVIRVSLIPSLDLDEAEQAFHFQQLRLGYGTQPPLYSWLQWIMFSVLGVNLFALSALKNLLLFLTYFSMYRIARPLIGTVGAIAVAASLILFPQIGWESQRDLTHSVLLTCLASLTLWCYFALLRRPDLPRYALLGLLIGLGLQSKYNFAVFATGLVCASLLTTEHRKIVWNRKAWVAIVIALLCMLPHGLWLLANFGATSNGTLEKMNAGARNAGYLRNVASGFGSIFMAALAFITPLWLIYGLACRRYWKQAFIDRRNSDARFFIFLYLAFFALVTAMALSGQVIKIKDRWMQPLLFSLPLAFFVALPVMTQHIVFRRIAQAAGFFALVILLALPLRGYLGPALGKPLEQYSYAQLSMDIARQFPEARTMVIDERLTAGNLYFQRPQVRMLLLDEMLRERPSLTKEVLLVLRVGPHGTKLEHFRRAYPLSIIRRQTRIELLDSYGSGKAMSFDIVLVAPAQER